MHLLLEHLLRVKMLEVTAASQYSCRPPGGSACIGEDDSDVLCLAQVCLFSETKPQPDDCGPCHNLLRRQLWHEDTVFASNDLLGHRRFFAVHHFYCSIMIMPIDRPQDMPDRVGPRQGPRWCPWGCHFLSRNFKISFLI